jgi:hypothetical protein
MRTCLRKVLSGERLEFAVAQSPGNMRVSVQAARSIGTRRAAAGMEDGRKFATESQMLGSRRLQPARRRNGRPSSYATGNFLMNYEAYLRLCLTRFERVTFAFGGQQSRYAASRRTVLSINRKNRVLRASATTCSPLHYASLQQRRHLRPLSGVQEHRDVADKGLLVLVLRAVIGVRIELRIEEMLL